MLRNQSLFDFLAVFCLTKSSKLGSNFIHENLASLKLTHFEFFGYFFILYYTFTSVNISNHVEDVPDCSTEYHFILADKAKYRNII